MFCSAAERPPIPRHIHLRFHAKLVRLGDYCSVFYWLLLARGYPLPVANASERLAWSFVVLCHQRGIFGFSGFRRHEI